MVRFSRSLTGVSSSSTNPFFDVKSVCAGCAWTAGCAGCCAVEAAGAGDAAVWANAVKDSKVNPRHKETFIGDPPATRIFRMFGENPGKRHYPPGEYDVQSKSVQPCTKMKRERFRAPLKTGNWLLVTGNCPLQYLGTFGSTLSAHAVIPPARFCTLVNPACRKNSTAFALRPPILQCTTISRLESSSFTRFGKSFSGIRCPPMLQIWYSCGSRTSRTNRSSFA